MMDQDKMVNQRQSQKGHSLVEVMVTMTILTILVVMVTDLAIQASRVHNYADRLGRSTELNQEILDQVRLDLLSSVRLFENNARGNAYLATLQNEGLTNVSQNLPTINAAGIFAKEATSASLSGNDLLFVKHAWTDEFLATSGKPYRTDVYRMVRYYLAVKGAGPTPGSSIGLNICHWVSEPLIDGAQIDGITDATDRAEVLAHLLNRTPDVEGNSRNTVAEVVWLLGADPAVAGTFRQVEVGGLLNNTAGPGRAGVWTILRDDRQSDDGILTNRHFSVATNFALTGTGVSRYSVMDNTGIGFPHGFEVQIIGPSSARQILLQLCVVSTNRDSMPAASTLRSIIGVREL